MKTTTTQFTIAITIATAALAMSALAGCVQTAPAAETGSTAVATATATPMPSPTPTVAVDPVVAAQVASGLTPEAYAAAAAAAELLDPTAPAADFNAQIAAISAANGGKPVVIIGHCMCPAGGTSAGLEAWGIGGALTAPQNACGYGWQVSREGAVGEVDDRATRRGWGPSDYILLFVDLR